MATSIRSKHVHRFERIRMQLIQNVLLIWLDDHIDDKNSDCRNTIDQLRRIVNTINTFTDGEKCVKFLKSVDNEKVCLIISGALGQHIVPHIHNMSQVDSIFIFCGDQKYHQQWAKDWPKIKGVFTQIDPIYQALKLAARQCEQNVIPISCMAINNDILKQNLNQLEPSFMYTQILKEILLSIKFQEKHIVEFTQHCRDLMKNNEKELKNVQQLERQYHEKTPIWWYTCDSFLYTMLNRALRVLDGDMIIKLGFFIKDLHRDIDKLYQEQFSGWTSSTTLTLYRGQGVNKDDFNKMSETKGGLLSFNCFLSTSKNREISVGFANNALRNPDLVGILFVMIVDPRQSRTPFASVANVGYFKDKEDEILFSMHTVFRISKITPMIDNPRIYQVNLILTNDNDKDLCALTDRIRQEAEGSTGWDQLGELLLKMGQPMKAQEMYEILLEQAANEVEKAHCLNQLGMSEYYLGEYKEALKFYENSLRIQQKLLSSTHTNIAKTHHWIGHTYWAIREYEKALVSHGKALEIRKRSLPSNHPDLAKSYSGLGNVYYSMTEYSQALTSYKKSLEIQKQSLPSNHPDLAKTYNNIGAVYFDTSEYSNALSSYEKALEIKKQSLPSNHPDLAKSFNNIGAVSSRMGDYEKARLYYERAIDIGKQSLPPNHPELQKWKKNLNIVKMKC